jgi:DNA adenine methylase
MQYSGGKFRICKQLAQFMMSKNTERKPYHEPFCGSCNVLQHIAGVKRTASDYSLPMIALWQALQAGWIPPATEVSEQMHRDARNGKLSPAMTAFVLHGCSFSGNCYGGYARSSKNNFPMNARNSLLRKLQKLRDVRFEHKSYTELDLENYFIYCDPPYANTVYGYATPTRKFDSELFWATMRTWSLKNDVYISEYIAPPDFECVLEIESKCDTRGRIHGTTTIPRTERVFKLKMGLT